MLGCEPNPQSCFWVHQGQSYVAVLGYMEMQEAPVMSTICFSNNYALYSTRTQEKETIEYIFSY